VSARVSALLDMQDVGVAVPRAGGGRASVLDHFDLTVAPGEMVGLVGESGSGKTIASLAVTRLLPPGAAMTGRVMLGGVDLTALDERSMRRVRGRDIGMVFQNPLAALNPTHTVGRQIMEGYRTHTAASPAAARARAVELLGEVGIREPARRLDDFPHQFSGGMRQRVMIAIALSCRPKLLIADEPTTGLDAIVAGQILALIARLRRELGIGLLFITHDLSVIEAHADSVHVLYAGRTVERGPAAAFFAAPRHPYSRALMGAVPRLGQSRLRNIPGGIPEPERRPTGCRFAPRCPLAQPVCSAAYPPPAPGPTLAACCFPQSGAIEETVAVAPPVHGRPGSSPVQLDVAGLTVRYGAGLAAVDGISLQLGQGECLGIVGESGSGKSTLGRAVLQMVGYEGTVTLDGASFSGLRGGALRRQRRRIQVVFQDPRESLNPRMRVGESIAEPLRLAGQPKAARLTRVAALLRSVGLDPALAERRPGSLSGGQAQRVAIARALAAEPEVLVLDEPTSSLDVSTQATLLNLLKDLARDRRLAMVFISHDLACVSYLADRIAVLQEGRLVELGATDALIEDPQQAYTANLVDAAPHLLRDRVKASA